jgi:hypothetical protein
MRKVSGLAHDQQHYGYRYSTDQHLRELNSDDFHAANPRTKPETTPG